MALNDRQSRNTERGRRTKPAGTDQPRGARPPHVHTAAGGPAEKVTRVTPDTVGKQVSKIPVALSTRFLEHFSEQLYSSPQKAFEELISNGWDAGATVVDVRIDANLQDPDATLAVFDNGTSMDLAGLSDLWHIAFSPKEGQTTEHGRPVIGKFGIGKLATYVLAEQLTYICRAADGIIRRVTMDYGAVDIQKEAEPDRLINDLELDVFELDTQSLATALEAVYDGEEILRLINQHAPEPREDGNTAAGAPTSVQEEFGGTPAKLERPVNGTWTLVVLSDLKETGRELKTGILRRILAAALPFGSEMAIHVNGERLRSTKMDAPVLAAWEIGPDLGIDSIELDETDGEPEATDRAPADDDANDEEGPGTKSIAVESGTKPHPHIKLPEIGCVTGMVRLFDEKISGGKSDERGASNGCIRLPG